MIGPTARHDCYLTNELTGAPPSVVRWLQATMSLGGEQVEATGQLDEMTLLALAHAQTRYRQRLELR